MNQEPETPLWNKLVALGVVIALVVLVIIFRHRIGGDFWPPDRSNVGPNLVASVVAWMAIFTTSVLLYPPWRRRLHRFVDNKLNPLHEKLNRQRDSHEELHRKLDHIIKHHPNIPELPQAKRAQRDMSEGER